MSKGAVLALIDDVDYRLEVMRDEAALKQAEAAWENTRSEHQRKAALFEEELVTRQQYDDVTTRLALGEAEVARTKAALSLAREKLAKTKIYSPLNGVVKEKKVTAGDYLRNGAPLFTVIQVDPLKLNLTIPEKDIGRLKPGQEVRFAVDSIPDRTFSGKVRIIYPNLEEKTRTLQVESMVPNRERLLKPGLFAKVTLYTSGPRDAVLVPVTSILYDDQKVKVFIIESERAKELEIKVGAKYGEMMEVLSGLAGGERIITAGQNNLAEGSKVNVAR